MRPFDSLYWLDVNYYMIRLALVNQSTDLVLMFLLRCEHLFCLLDHPMLMNALYIEYHLQHQNTHYHVHCPTPDCTLLVQNRQKALVFHLCHIILLQLRVGSQDLISISIAKWVRYFICRTLLRSQH
jgi:hypothetical protein